ncbi:hypothetical protein BE61_38890 [Bradyrhizobium elkanii USDA 61]|nr:hypothetical protein BE61_38890 [Bradyrhizobium elkanii USDA 61]
MKQTSSNRDGNVDRARSGAPKRNRRHCSQDHCDRLDLIRFRGRGPTKAALISTSPTMARERGAGAKLCVQSVRHSNRHGVSRSRLVRHRTTLGK